MQITRWNTDLDEGPECNVYSNVHASNVAACLTQVLYSPVYRHCGNDGGASFSQPGKKKRQVKNRNVEKVKKKQPHICLLPHQTKMILCISYTIIIYRFIKIPASVLAPELVTNVQLPSSPPTPNPGSDSWGLWGAWWIICAQKELQAGGKFRDKSNKMVKSTASWTIYLSGTDMSFSLSLYGSTPAASLVKAHSSPGFIETLIQFPQVVTF